jgi:hypothetical protein
MANNNSADPPPENAPPETETANNPTKRGDSWGDFFKVNHTANDDDFESTLASYLNDSTELFNLVERRQENGAILIPSASKTVRSIHHCFSELGRERVIADVADRIRSHPDRGPEPIADQGTGSNQDRNIVAALGLVAGHDPRNDVHRLQYHQYRSMERTGVTSWSQP